MGALLFDGVDDRIRSTSLGSGLANLSAGNVGTLLWLFKAPSADSDFDALGYLLSGTGAGTAQWGLSINASEVMQMDLPNSRTAGTGFATNVFMFLVSKPAGASVTCRAHYKTAAAGAWTHANFSGAENFATAATMLEIGAWQGADFFGSGHQGIFAAWAANFADADAEACDNNWRTSDLYNHSAGIPVSLIEMNTLTPVDIGSSPAASLAVTGTTVSAETLDSWTFDGTGAAAAVLPSLVMPPLAA